MQQFEYKVVPAPNRGKKSRGVKTPEARFANGVETVLNEMAAQGWEFQRAEMLPSEERSGFTGSKTNWRNLLVFRRALASASTMDSPAEPQLQHAAQVTAAAAAAEDAAPALLSETEPEAEEEFTTAEAVAIAPPVQPEPPLTATAGDPEAPAEAVPVPGPGARKMISDDGVEELSPVAGITAALKTRAGLKLDD